jgi:hypothetical protein
MERQRVVRRHHAVVFEASDSSVYHGAPLIEVYRHQRVHHAENGV